MLLQDVRYAWRMLRGRPVATLGVVLSLAFAIGVNASIVSLADQTLFKPLPVREPDRLVSLYGIDTASGKYHGTSYQNYRDYRDRVDAVSGLAAFGRYPLEIADGARLTSIPTEEVTGNYFEVLQSRPLLGRLLTPADDNAGSPPVVVIGERAWRARFNRDARIVGETMTLGGRAFTIVGVVPEEFRGVLLDWNGEPDIWIPLAHLRTVIDSTVAGRLLDDPQVDWMMIVGRLQPGATLDRARAAFTLVASQIPQPTYDRAAKRTVALFATNHTKFWPGARDSVQGRLTILIAGAALLLLLACVNVATLLVERGMERQNEIALRLALGAGRARIVRLLLTESALLAASSLAAALLVARFTTGIVAQFPGGLGHTLSLDTQFDGRTFAICVGVTLFVMIACALTPMLWMMRTDALVALRSSATRIAGSSRRATFIRNTLVAAQVAISMIVLMSAGAFIDTLTRASHVSAGFNTDQLLFVQPDFSAKRYRPTDTAVQFTERVIARLESTGTITAATWTDAAPLSPFHHPVTLSREAADPIDITADADSVASNYFETLGIRLIAGRSFNIHDRRDAPRVAIVNQAMARQLWGEERESLAAAGADADARAGAGVGVGRRFWLRGGPNRPPEACEVIGVAVNTRYTSLWEDRPRVFFPLAQTDAYPNAIILRVRGTAAAETVTAAIHDAVTASDPQLPLPRIQSWSQTRESSLVQQKLGLTLFATFSSAMLLLTVVGLYSVMSSRVTQRRQELAIRLALGAAPQHLRRNILGHAALIAICGALPGTAAGRAATSFVASILPGLEPSTTTAAVAIGLALITITTLATLAPARRAASTDPMRVLKEQ